MKPKTLLLLGVAGSCGLIAMLGVQQALQGHQAPVKVDSVKVLVALENIDTGVKLTEENTSFKSMSRSSVPEDAATKLEDFEQRAAKVPFQAGDMIRKTKLTEKGEWGMSIAIPPGMRVIGIPVDDSHTISGLIRPGDRVDVLVTYQGRGDRGSPVSKTKTLLEYVEVFGMDDQTANKIDEKSKGNRAKIASLILTPEQTGFVILAQRKGSLSLSWRRRGDDELAQTKDVDEKLMEELQGTVGINDGDSFAYFDRNPEFAQEESSREGSSTEQFLNETAAPQSTGTSPLAVAPAAGLWTIDIYSGNEVVSQQFELPVEAVMTKETGTPSELDETFQNLNQRMGVR